MKIAAFTAIALVIVRIDAQVSSYPYTFQVSLGDDRFDRVEGRITAVFENGRQEHSLQLGQQVRSYWPGLARPFTVINTK